MTTAIFKRYQYQLVLLLCIMLIAIWGFDNNYERPLKNSTIGSTTTDTSAWPKSFGFGRVVTPREISVLDISIKPNGEGLPAGSGNVASGRSVYELKCMACHGRNGIEGPFSPLIGAMGDTIKAKTIGNYWPYSTTLFDYIRRAMPFNQPGSLTNNEVYSLTAYLLYKNKITDQATVLNAANLPKIKMPALPLFIDDDRHGGSEIK